MKLTPDHFQPVTDSELRELWRLCRDPAIRRLILEVHRSREIRNLTLRDIHDAQRALWDKNASGAVTRITNACKRLERESVRLGSHGGKVVDIGRAE